MNALPLTTEPTGAVSPSFLPIWARAFDELLAEAVRFHGHLCPGQVLGVRVAQAGCRVLGIAHPRAAGKRLVVFVEIDRCAADAIQALTGVSVGKRTLKHVDFGKMAATFADAVTGDAVRVAARDDARERAGAWAPHEADPRRAQVAAYRVLPEPLLLRLERVRVAPGWLDRKRVRVSCQRCGEGVNYERHLTADGQPICRACAGARYYTLRDD
jgi:formylmethanofuran dehydrogenase subunit E